jgi:CRISPR-associated protein Cmr6
MPGSACRRELEVIAGQDGPFSHPGLGLHRYLLGHATAAEKREGRRPEIRLLRRAAASEASPAYRAAFQRWRTAQEGRGALLFAGEAAAPLAIGLGNESPLEIGLTTHHTYGMPVIPGAALKGLARRGAQRLLQQERLVPEQFLALFGNTASASHFVFWDAWYDPESPGGRPFKRDVITVHHPDYYSRRGAGTWPTDFDDPNPVPFLVVRPGARFLFAVDAPSSEWSDFGERLLRWSLEELGVGGKTNAGYGVFRFPQWRPRPREETWPDCRVERRIVRGAVEVRVESARGELVIPQQQWQPVEATLAPEVRERLKKRAMRAAVRVRREGDAVRFLRIEMFLPDEGAGQP